MSETKFEDIGLSPELVQAVSDMNYTQATGIQAQAIPLLMQGADVIGRSSTGTGKTAAFGIPAVERIESGLKAPQVLVLSPTRELAMQIAGEIRKFAKYKPGVCVAAVYGGAPMDAQIRALRAANIVIGTPGRVMDHMRRHTLRLDDLRTVVLDEADEMLNMGFLDDIQTILAETPDTRQTVLFSATMPPAILKITDKFLHDPQTVDIRTGQRTIAAVEQFFYRVPQARKMDALNLLLQYHDPKRAVVFCNTKAMVDSLTEYLGDHGFRALGIHGDMKQTGRTQVMQSFRDGKTRILVATDVAARGIDVENIEAVFNFDIPQEFEHYIHRIGRTGRAGRTGMSHTLVCGARQVDTIRQLRRFINADIREAPLPIGDEIVRKKREKFAARVARTLEADEYGKWGEQLDAIAAERGCDMRDIACALAQMIAARDKKLIPVLKIPAPGERPVRGGRRVVLRADAGRAQNVTPANFVAAIADASGLPARAIGKIDIFEDSSLIELYENDALTVLEAMRSTRIRGLEVHFALTSEKPRYAARGGVTCGREKPFFRPKPSQRRDRASYNDRNRRRMRDE